MRHDLVYAKTNNSIQLFILFSLSFVLFVIAAFRPLGIDNDSLTYESEIVAFYKGNSEIKEPIFIAFSYISEKIFNENTRVVFILFTLHCLFFLKPMLSPQYSKNPFILGRLCRYVFSFCMK